MTSFFTNMTLLIVGLLLLILVLLASYFVQRQVRSYNRYVASGFEEMGDLVDVLKRRKQEIASLEETKATLESEIRGYASNQKLLADLEAELKAKEAQLFKMEADIREVSQARAELKTWIDQTERLRQEEVELKKKIDELVDTKKQEETQKLELQAQVAKQKTDMENLQRQYDRVSQVLMDRQLEQDRLQHQIDQLKLDRQAAEKACREAQAHQSQMVAQSDTIKEQLNQLKSQAEQVEGHQKEIAQQKITLEAIQNELTRNKEELRQLEQKKHYYETLIAEKDQVTDALKKQRQQLESLRAIDQDRQDERIKLEARVQQLKEQLAELTRESEEHEADDLIRQPHVLNHKPTIKTQAILNEGACIEAFETALDGALLKFHPRTIRSFHTALKSQFINPLTVLAGVSGTGKTLLPIQYAHFMGMLQLTLSVQPRWDSPQDLFGFYNYLEHRYKATELARLLYAYNHDESLTPYMSLVLFDEMNLARTEYYFSDFLSKLELRRAKADDAQIAIDISNRTERIAIPENLLIVGTMNEDESTQTLSDKVLDRANVLRFGKPDQVLKESQFNKTVPMAKFVVTKAIWKAWQSQSALETFQLNKVVGWIGELNNAMDRIGRPFGYRVQEAMLEYTRLYPTMGGNDYQMAFADQIEQKILPKLRGIDTESNEYQTVIDQIRRVVDDTGDKELSEAVFKASHESKEQGIFVWPGVTRKE